MLRFAALRSHLRHLTKEALSGASFEAALDGVTASIA